MYIVRPSLSAMLAPGHGTTPMGGAWRIDSISRTSRLMWSWETSVGVSSNMCFSCPSIVVRVRGAVRRAVRGGGWRGGWGGGGGGGLAGGAARVFGGWRAAAVRSGLGAVRVRVVLAE